MPFHTTTSTCTSRLVHLLKAGLTVDPTLLVEPTAGNTTVHTHQLHPKLCFHDLADMALLVLYMLTHGGPFPFGNGPPFTLNRGMVYVLILLEPKGPGDPLNIGPLGCIPHQAGWGGTDGQGGGGGRQQTDVGGGSGPFTWNRSWVGGGGCGQALQVDILKLCFKSTNIYFTPTDTQCLMHIHTWT